MLALLFSLAKPLLVFLLVSGFLLGTIYLAYRDQPLLNNVLSHWTQSIPNLQCTASEFYERVVEMIRELKMPGVTIHWIDWREGGILSDKREYLRIRRVDHSFDLCVAPFGNTLFVSSWLCAFPHPFRDFCANVPFLGWLVRAYVRLCDPDTYYRYDSAAMFQGTVHNCVLTVLDEMTTAQGLDPIPEIERKPVMRELYGRRQLAA